MSRRWLLLVVPLALSACGGEDDEESNSTEAAATGDEPCGTEWEAIGTGVAYKTTGDGDGVFIGYGGYSVRSKWSCAWADALHRARLKELGVGHVFAVKGPSDPGYGAREIGNSKLAARLVAGPAERAPFILVAAHSSGSYVAHELLGQLYSTTRSLDPSGTTRDKIVYANLDGGDAGLDARLVGELRRVAFVWAEDTTLASGRSTNAGFMDALGDRYGDAGLRIQTDRTGCRSGAKWCLHDALITTKPHNPAHYDLQRDYTDFAGRPVQSAWIDALAPSLLR